MKLSHPTLSGPPPHQVRFIKNNADATFVSLFTFVPIIVGLLYFMSLSLDLSICVLIYHGYIDISLLIP